MFIFFTELTGKDVVDRHGRWLGHPYDFFAKLDEPFPTVSDIIVAKGHLKKQFYVIPISQISFQNGQIQVRQPVESLTVTQRYREPMQASLRTSILDQQVVDTYNRKVVRVNDLHFLRVGQDLRLVHVDVGLRGLVRRLGWGRLVDGMVRLLNRHARYLTDEGFIAWKFVQPIDIQVSTGRLKLSIEQEELKKIPPPDISEMLMELDPQHRVALFKTIDVERQVEIITELELKWQRELIEDLDTRTAVDLMERMPADEATDLLGALPRRSADRILGMLSNQKARDLSELLEHESDTAGGLMTTEFITLMPGMTVEEAIEHIKRTELRKAETIYYGYVIDETERLLGAVSFRKLLLEPLDATMDNVMQVKPPSVHVDASVKEVAYVLDKYNLFALPAVDDEGKLEGIITIDDVLSIIIDDAYGKKPVL
ncbi:MAG: magnesium transporter [candidate division Zixibacteria bacterium]|nr:magnesium transporter [candidate division Zixibacteria bacterium]